MKKHNKLLTIFVLIFIIIAFFITLFIEIVYDTSLVDYFKSSKPLTKEEKDWLKNHGNIIYCADQNAPPLRYVDEQDGQYKGIVIDYINALSIELGTEIEIKPMVWENALSSLAKSETDICDMFKSQNRQKKYLFSEPILYNLRGVILTSNSHNDINTYDDLQGERVAAPKGEYAVEYLQSKVDDIDYHFTKDIYNAILLLQDGEVDAVIGDESVISYFISNMDLSSEMSIVDPPMYVRQCVFGVPKDNPILLKILNKGIFNLRKKRITEKIQQKWFGISDQLSEPKKRIGIQFIIIILIIVAIYAVITYLFYSWNRTLQKEVKKRTEELYMSKKDLQTTFDALTHYMVLVDKDKKIVNTNKVFCELVDKNKEDIIGVEFVKLNERFKKQNIKDIIDDTFRYKKEQKSEFEHEDRIYDVATFPLKDNEKNIIKVLLMIKDITENRIGEKQLLQTNKMVAIGQLAAGVAHEIRNPLGLIRNYIYVLKMKLNMDDTNIKKAIEKIETSVNRASNIINNLLNFSRISGNRKESINIKRFIKNVLELERKIMEKNKIEFRLRCEDMIVNINQESLKHIIINLVTNAIDAMPQGGKLDVKCEKIKDNLYIWCRDTGIGIEKKDLDNIFNPFFTTKGVGKGTGLGLYILYTEVEKFGGDIQVFSEVLKGTTFKVHLPLKE